MNEVLINTDRCETVHPEDGQQLNLGGGTIFIICGGDHIYHLWGGGGGNHICMHFLTWRTFFGGED